MDVDEELSADAIIGQSLEAVIEDPSQLPEYFPVVCEYHTYDDKATRLSVIRFLAEVSRRHLDKLTEACGVLDNLLADDDSDVVVRCIMAINQLYRSTFYQVVSMQTDKAEQFRDHWRALTRLQTTALHYANSGGRKPGTLAQAPTRVLVSAAALRLYETVVANTLIVAPPGINSDGAPKKCMWEDHECYAKAPHPLLNRDALNTAAEVLFKELLSWAQMGGTAGAATTHNPGGFFSKEQYVVCLAALQKIALKSPPHFKKVADVFYRLLSRDGRPRRRDGVLSDVQAGMILSSLRSLSLFMVAHSKKGTAVLQLTPVQERDRKEATEKLVEALARNEMTEYVRLVMPDADLGFLVGEDMGPTSLTPPPILMDSSQQALGSSAADPRLKPSDPRKRGNIASRGNGGGHDHEIPLKFVSANGDSIGHEEYRSHAREARRRMRDGNGKSLMLQLGSHSAFRDALLARLGTLADEGILIAKSGAEMDTRPATLWSTIEHCLEENLMFLPQREELLVALLYELYKPDKEGSNGIPTQYESALREIMTRLQEKASTSMFKYVKRFLLEVPAMPLSILTSVKKRVAAGKESLSQAELTGIKILRICCLQRSGPQTVRLHALDCLLDLACHEEGQIRKEVRNALAGGSSPAAEAPELKKWVERHALLLLQRVSDLVYAEAKMKASAGEEAVQATTGQMEITGEEDEDEDEPLLDEDDSIKTILTLPTSLEAVSGGVGSDQLQMKPLSTVVPALDDNTMRRLFEFPVAISSYSETVFTQIYYLYANAAPIAATTAIGLAAAEAAAKAAALEKRKQGETEMIPEDQEKDDEDDESLKSEMASAVATASDFLPMSASVAKRAIDEKIETIVKYAMVKFGKINVMRLIRSTPDPANQLIFCTLEIIANSSELNSLLSEAQKLLSAAIELEKERKRDVRYLVPFLGAANEDQFRKVLHRLLPWTQKDLDDVNQHSLLEKISETEGRPLSISNFEQAVRLKIKHAGPKDSNAAIRCATTIICSVAHIIPSPEVQRSVFAAFEVLCSSSAVSLKSLEEALIQLSQEQPMPISLLRLLLECTRQRRGLGQFICQKIMPLLVQNQIWTQRNLWPGFIQLAKKYSSNKPPNCLSALLLLPEQPFKMLIGVVVELKKSLPIFLHEQPQLASQEQRKLLGLS